MKKEFKPNIFFYGYLSRKLLFKKVAENAYFIKGKVLDFGCGSKPYQSLFSCNEYIGLDYYGEGHSHKNEQIDMFYDGVTIPYARNHFDSVFSCQVLEHVYNFKEMIKELNRVLKPGGTFLLICPFSYSEHETPADYFRYTSFGIKKVLEENGFKIIKQEKIGGISDVIIQYILSYFSTHVTKKIPIVGGLVEKGLSVILNLLGITLSFFCRKNSELYLDNLIIAKKV